MIRPALASLLILTAMACGDDGGAPDGSAGPCVVDDDCGDGVFCNGVESCAPDDGAADGRGCVAGTEPCVGGCDEMGDVCDGSCVDADRDGFEDVLCGGDDCDDSDANRFPGNTEICDAAGHDEDCRSETVGPDADGDGAAANACCNRDVTGELVCGADCDDTRSGVNMGGTEACNGLDDDCDGTLDEGTQLTFYRDVDGDGFGLDDDSTLGCSAPTGYAVNGNDCDDTNRNINPSAADGPPGACDGANNDCDDTIDEGCACSAEETFECGPRDGEGNLVTEGICQPGIAECTEGMVGTCVGAVSPESADGPGAALCDGEDSDCDGAIDEDCECQLGTSEVCGTNVGECSVGSRTCVDGSWGSCSGAVTPDAEACDTNTPALDEDCDGQSNEGCACPGAGYGACTNLQVSSIGGPAAICSGYLFSYVAVRDGGSTLVVDVSCAANGAYIANDVAVTDGGSTSFMHSPPRHLFVLFNPDPNGGGAEVDVQIQAW